jgi:hypothetical protein
MVHSNPASHYKILHTNHNQDCGLSQLEVERRFLLAEWKDCLCHTNTQGCHYLKIKNYIFITTIQMLGQWICTIFLPPFNLPKSRHLRGEQHLSSVTEQLTYIPLHVSSDGREEGNTPPKQKIWRFLHNKFKCPSEGLCRTSRNI